MIDLETDILDMQITSLGLDQNNTISCKLLEKTLNETNTKVSSISSEILTYESEEKILTGDYDLLKQRLILTRIRIWLVATRLNEYCNYNYTSILYFYSIDGKCDRCQQQGTITSYVSEISNGNVQISAIDVNEGLAVVRALKEIYNVTTTPTLVFNSVEIHRGFIDRNSLIKKVCSYYNYSDLCK